MSHVLLVLVLAQRVSQDDTADPVALQNELEELVQVMKRRGEQLHMLKRSFAVRGGVMALPSHWFTLTLLGAVVFVLNISICVPSVPAVCCGVLWCHAVRFLCCVCF